MLWLKKIKNSKIFFIHFMGHSSFDNKDLDQLVDQIVNQIVNQIVDQTELNQEHTPTTTQER